MKLIPDEERDGGACDMCHRMAHLVTDKDVYLCWVHAKMHVEWDPALSEEARERDRRPG